MLRRRRLWLGILALIALAGCESTASLDPKQAENFSADKAILAFTVSHDKDSDSMFRRGANVKFFVYLRDATRGKDLPRGFSNMETMSPMMTSVFDDVWARTFVREVEPGRIEFTNWEVIQNNGPLGIRSAQPKATPSPISIELKAGTVTYIGNLHARLLWAKNPFGIDILAGAAPEIRNEAVRDLRQIFKDYPALEGRVVVQPMPIGPWAPGAPQ